MPLIAAWVVVRTPSGLAVMPRERARAGHLTPISSHRSEQAAREMKQWRADQDVREAEAERNRNA